MSSRIRGKEASIRLAVDGQDQTGSFLKVSDWEVNPDIAIVKTDFTGEDRPDGDVNARGFDGTFSIQELDNKAEALLQLIDDNEAAHIAPPKVVLSHFKLYRQAGAGSIGHVYHDVILTCTQSTRAEGSSYVGSKWSWYAPRRDAISS